MKYKSQLITTTVICETAPTANEPSAVVYVNIPKGLNVFRVSIWNDDSFTAAISTCPGGVSTIPGTHVDDYHYIPPTSRGTYPYKLEARTGYIEDGFYLAAITPNVGEGCIFHILFEGEQ